MGIDLKDLSPAPWEASERRVLAFPPEGCRVVCYTASGKSTRTPASEADAAFIALARNDLEVKLRRGWHTEKCSDADQWVVPQLLPSVMFRSDCGGIEAIYQDGHDVGLLTKADEWLKALEVKES